MSELEIFTSMYEDWVGFVQNTLAGHWIIYIIVLVDMIVTTSIAISTTDVISLAKPLNQWKVWAIWLFGGLWGAHWLCLNPKNNKYRYPEYDSGHVYEWFFVSAFTTIVIMVLLTFHLFDGQYGIAATWLLVLIFCNILIGIGRIPYSVKRFNAQWYRRYFETNLIMKNKPLPVDTYLVKMKQRMNEFGKKLKIVQAIADDSDYGKENADTSFFKNIVTFGNYNKLQREKGRLNMLAETCDALDDEIRKNETVQIELENYLEQYRAAAYRNINLCKDLLSLLKKIEGKHQKLVSDDFIYIPKLSNVNITAIINMQNAEFNTDVFGQYTASSFESVGNTLTEIQENGEKITSTDLAVGAIEIGLSAIADGISGIIDMNTEVSNQRDWVKDSITEVTDKLEVLVPKLNTYRSKILRQGELLEALKELCFAFIKIYEPLRRSVYNDKGGLKDGYKKFLMQANTQKQLGLLAAICSRYSKVNNEK